MGQYELKKGVLLQAFGDASKTCTNDNLTDELAEWHLKQCPEKSIYFSRIPEGASIAPVITRTFTPTNPPPVMRIVPPVIITPPVIPPVEIISPIIPEEIPQVEEKKKIIRKPKK
jgi:hypothetical protein